jgi:CheY-like chemotaxis protein/AraC-like DNA-binding protein/nitrogen-specific signal transduction histidine kinase
MSGTVLFFILNYLKDKNLAQEKEKKQKQEMDEFKSHLYTNITHEFRTPLTLIQGMATEIQDNPKLSAERASHMILRNSRKLLKLVNQMLALSKLETGIEKANYIQSDIIAYLKYCIESFYSATEAKGIRLKFKTSFNNYVVDFDPEKLESIMTNLISNAIKHTEEDGIIDIVLKKKEAKNGNNMFEIKISDSGVGIDKDKLSKIFDRFYQADEALDHQSVGSGVGLTIVREYIHLMGGIIEVESKVGEGSEFTISLPVSHEAPLADSINVLSVPRSESNITHESIVHIANTNAPRLLIVEDNPDLVSFLQALLGIDYQIITASNGEEGLKQAFDKIPDIIISDVMMPKMDGFSFLKQIKNDIRTSHIPVIMLTAKVDMKSRLEGLESGADAYLSKPFNKQELFVRLRKLLELREHLQQRYSGFEIIPETTETRIQKEDEFINNVKTIIQEDLSNEHINLDDLYKQMGMSRSKFYRKFSALTNMGIHKYIRNYRLHVARKILLAGTLNVSQTAAEVGYSNISYFSRIFKEEFGINPSQIKPSGT